MRSKKRLRSGSREINTGAELHFQTVHRKCKKLSLFINLMIIFLMSGLLTFNTLEAENVCFKN